MAENSSSSTSNGTNPLQPRTQRSDHQLLQAVRSAEHTAYSELLVRHGEAASRLAVITQPAAAERTASLAFTEAHNRILTSTTPVEFFRRSLLESVCELADPAWYEKQGDRQLDDELAAQLSCSVPVLQGAFDSLPEAWQLLLWHTDVEGDTAQDIAKFTGNSTAKNAEHTGTARLALHRAYVDHRAKDLASNCRVMAQRLTGYVHRSLTSRQTDEVGKHLESCLPCTGVKLELQSIHAAFPYAVTIAVLGPAGISYYQPAAKSRKSLVRGAALLAGTASAGTAGHNGLAVNSAHGSSATNRSRAAAGWLTQPAAMISVAGAMVAMVVGAAFVFLDDDSDVVADPPTVVTAPLSGEQSDNPGPATPSAEPEPTESVLDDPSSRNATLSEGSALSLTRPTPNPFTSPQSDPQPSDSNPPRNQSGPSGPAEPGPTAAPPSTNQPPPDQGDPPETQPPAPTPMPVSFEFGDPINLASANSRRLNLNLIAGENTDSSPRTITVNFNFGSSVVFTGSAGLTCTGIGQTSQVSCTTQLGPGQSLATFIDVVDPVGDGNFVVTPDDNPAGAVSYSFSLGPWQGAAEYDPEPFASSATDEPETD